VTPELLRKLKMSMQIVEKSGEGLSRVYGVTVPAKDLTDKLEARIAEITPTLNLKGFRPGKVPAGHVRRLYGKSLMSEVIQATVDESTQKTLDDNKLRPATQPDFKLESDMDKVIEGAADLAYELQVEIMPDFEPVDAATLSLTRPVYEPEDAEVEEALADIASQSRTYETREGASATAEDGDMVIIDFIGRIDGEAFEGGSGTDAQLVLGSGQFIPGFEEQLVGAAPGQSVTVKVTFPEDYQAENLKGKAAEFETTVKEVRAPKSEEIDDAFAEKVGLKDLAALKEAVRGQVQGRYQSQSRFKLKRQLLDVLDSKHDFPLPPRMVDAEFDAIWQQVQADKARGGLPPEDAEKSDEQLTSEYRKIAERRVRLGLVLAEIGRAHNVQVTDQEITQAARTEAMRYGAQAQQIFDYFRNNPQAQAQLRAPIYEDKVVDLIFGLAKIEDKPVSKEELLADDELPEGYADADAKPAKKSAPKKAKAEAAPAEEAVEVKPAKKAAPKKAKAEAADEAEGDEKPAAKKAAAKKKAE
jgi:trigger factor